MFFVPGTILLPENTKNKISLLLWGVYSKRGNQAAKGERRKEGRKKKKKKQKSIKYVR